MAHLLGELFQGPGAVNAIPWIEEHHKDDLENLGLVDWLAAIDMRASCGIHRASSGMDYSMGELLCWGSSVRGLEDKAMEVHRSVCRVGCFSSSFPAPLFCFFLFVPIRFPNFFPFHGSFVRFRSISDTAGFDWGQIEISTGCFISFKRIIRRLSLVTITIWIPGPRFSSARNGVTFPSDSDRCSDASTVSSGQNHVYNMFVRGIRAGARCQVRW